VTIRPHTGTVPSDIALSSIDSRLLLPSSCLLGPDYIKVWVEATTEEDHYFDFHVPVFNNYWAEGLWHHNSGKSTILSAISYLCFGDVPLLTQEVREVNLISDGATADAVVEGEVELATGEVLNLTRGRTRSNSPIVRMDGYAGKPSDVSFAIEEKVGLPFEDFVALSYFVQGDIHQFMDGSKRDYFQRWAHRLRRWERYEESAKSYANSLELQRQRLLHDAERHKITPAEESEARLELESARLAQASAVQREALLRTQTDALAGEVAELRRRESESVADARGAHRELAQVEALVSSLERRASTLESQTKETAKGVCPILKAPCDRLAGRGDDKRDEARRELREVRASLTQARDRFYDLSRQLKTAKAASRHQDEAPGKALEQARQDLGEAVSAAARASQRLGRAQEKVAALKHHRAKVKELRASASASEAGLRRARFVQAMCGRSGIPMEVMDAELQAVEDKCNWVLSRLDYPKRIRFAAFRELAGFERVCPHCGGESWRDNTCSGCGAPRPRKRKDEPTVTVLDGSAERAFSLESGGARVLQSFAVRLACSLFVSSMTGARVRMVMLDEVFAMLDAANRQKLMSLVIGKLSSEFGLRQQLVVSHQEDVVNAVDDILVVQRSGGSSVATWA